jgi:hypothetical protein
MLIKKWVEDTIVIIKNNSYNNYIEVIEYEEREGLSRESI